jgi:hypothetical protein
LEAKKTVDVPKIESLPHETRPETGGTRASREKNSEFNERVQIPAEEFELEGEETEAFDGHDQLMDRASLDQELLRSGYTPRGHVFVKPLRGPSKVGPEFIKTSNKLGQTVYIMLDLNCAGDVSGLRLAEVANPSIISFSTKAGVLESAGHYVTGVAIECGGGLCVLSRDPETLTLVEKNFMPVDFKTQSEEYVGSYPIVKLSELRADPRQTLANTMVAARRIRKIAAQNCVEELSALKSAIEELTRSYNNFVKVRDTYDKEICNSLLELETIEKGYVSEPTSEQGKANLRTLRYNLYKRYEFSDTLLRVCRRASNRAGRLRAEAAEINLLSEYCNQEFSGVTRVLEET